MNVQNILNVRYVTTQMAWKHVSLFVLNCIHLSLSSLFYEQMTLFSVNYIYISVYDNVSDG